MPKDILGGVFVDYRNKYFHLHNFVNYQSYSQQNICLRYAKALKIDCYWTIVLDKDLVMKKNLLDANHDPWDHALTSVLPGPRTPQGMDGTLTLIFAKLETT